MLSSEPTRACSVLSQQSSNAAVRHDVTHQLTGNGGAPLPITGISALQNENNTPVQQRLHIETHQQHKTHTVISPESLLVDQSCTAEEIPYISLDEFLSPDSDDTSSLNRQDLCVRLADQQQQHLSYDEQQQQQQRVILEPQAPGSPHTNFDLDSKTAISKGGTHGGTSGPMRNSPLTPSPSSSSSQENEDEMGYLGPSQFSIFRRQAAPVQLNFRESALPRLSAPPASVPAFEGSDEEFRSSEETSQQGTLSRKEVRRRSKKPVPDEKKDDNYWRRRHKNNLAAKRSREARRQKESELSKRATLLEMEHDQLRSDLEIAQRENEELKKRLSKYEDINALELH